MSLSTVSHIGPEAAQLRQQIAADDDETELEDLQPTDDFITDELADVLRKSEALLDEFESTLASLSVEDEFDTAMIVDSPEDLLRHLQSNSDLQRDFPWQRLLLSSIEHGKAPRVTRLCIGKNVKRH
jgi:hypothetical protein